MSGRPRHHPLSFPPLLSLPLSYRWLPSRGEERGGRLPSLLLRVPRGAIAVATRRRRGKAVTHGGAAGGGCWRPRSPHHCTPKFPHHADAITYLDLPEHHQPPKFPHRADVHDAAARRLPLPLVPLPSDLHDADDVTGVGSGRPGAWHGGCRWLGSCRCRPTARSVLSVQIQGDDISSNVYSEPEFISSDQAIAPIWSQHTHCRTRQWIQLCKASSIAVLLQLSLASGQAETEAAAMAARRKPGRRVGRQLQGCHPWRRRWDRITTTPPAPS